MTRGEPHAAFPSAPVPSSSRAGGSGSGAGAVGTWTAPTAADIRTLIDQSTTLSAMETMLVPALEHAASETDQSSLLQPELKLEELPDADLGGSTAALVYILMARLNKANRYRSPDQELSVQTSRFCSFIDVDQARLCLSRISHLAWALLRHAQICKQVQGVMKALYALATVPPYPGSMLGSQAAFLEACLLIRHYQPAVPIIQDVYTDFKAGSCTYLDVVTFYHHAGLITAALRDFEGARDLFAVAVSMPTQSPSAIQIAAAKRAILCEILATGKSLKFPSSTSSSVVRAIEKGATEYTNLAKAFGARRWSAVQQQAKDGRKVYDQDCNAGLVQLVLASVLKQKIHKARHVYSRLTAEQLLAKVAGDEPTTVDQMITVLQEMVSNGEVAAEISTDSSPIITFYDDSSVSSGPDAVAQLARSKHLAAYLESHLVGTGKQLGLDHRYLKKQAGLLDAMGSKGNGRGGKADDIEMMLAAEESIGRPVRGVGSNLADMGF